MNSNTNSEMPFTPNQQAPQKNSTLSVLALIFSITGCLCFIGLILSIIDLVQRDNSKKHSLSKAADHVIVYMYRYHCMYFRGAFSHEKYCVTDR